jgi:hypothetical protein
MLCLQKKWNGSSIVFVFNVILHSSFVCVCVCVCVLPLGLVQKVDQRLPVANEYLLLSGGAREGVLDLNPEELGDYAKGADFDLDFTLLVPALKLHDRNQVGAAGTGM